MNTPTGIRYPATANMSEARRKFLRGASALATAPLLGLSGTAAAEPPPETRRIRLVHAPNICLAPQYLAEELLRLEGFSEVTYVEAPNAAPSLLAARQADMTMWGAPESIPLIDERKAIVLLAGVHAGCWELFAGQRVETIRELKGKKVAVSALGSAEHIFVSSMLAYVGIDPGRSVEWLVKGSYPEAMRAFEEGKADAFLAVPPMPQDLRARKVGHVIVNTTQDRPWSQYFCCMLMGSRDFVSRYPVASKRALRAILKAADICAQEPERAAKFLADRGYEPRYDMGLEVLKSLPYNRWRDANPEDTIRFHALRLHEVGMVKTSPQKLIAQGTDWRFLNEIKKELKA